MIPSVEIGQMHIDAVLMREDKRVDTIFEIKYIKKRFRSNWVRETALKLKKSAQIYFDESGRETFSVLLIVLADSAENTEKLEKYLEKAKNYLGKSGSICLMSEHDIDDFPCHNLWDKLYKGGIL